MEVWATMGQLVLETSSLTAATTTTANTTSPSIATSYREEPLLTAQAGTSDQLVQDTTLGSATNNLPGPEVSAGKATMLTMVILQTTTDTGTRKRQGQFSTQASSTKRYFSTF